MHKLQYKNRTTILYPLLVLLFRILVDCAYIFYLNPQFEYMGFTLHCNILKIIESYLMLFILLILVQFKDILPSHIAVINLLCIGVVPLLSIYALKGLQREYIYGVFLSFVILVVFVNVVPRIKIQVRSKNNYTLITIIGVITLLSYVILYKNNGIPTLDALNFNNVYTVRDSFITSDIKVVDYFISWQGTVTNIVIIYYALKTKKKMLIILALFLQFELYLMSGHKTFLLYPIIIMVGKYIFLKGKYMVLLLGGLNTVAIVSIAIHIICGNSILKWMPSLFLSRALFLPAQISFQYYEYFSENGFALLSSSFFRFFFKEPIYPSNPILLIGEKYYSNNWPNTGIWGDAYMNFGLIGLISFSIVLGIVLLILDSLSNTQGKRDMTNSYIIIFSALICNMGFFTALLTGGLLAYMFFLLLYKEGNAVVGLKER